MTLVPTRDAAGGIRRQPRAKAQLFRLGLVREDERAGVSKVLDAAALTYVAALVSSVLNCFTSSPFARRQLI